MPKYVPFAVAVLGLTFIGACAFRSASAEPTSEMPPDSKTTPAVSEAPQPPMIQGMSVTAIYNENCAKCHGQNGEGGGAGTKTLNTVEKYDQKNDKPFFDAIKKGVPDMGMESYAVTMNDETIWAMVVHIREMQHRALRRSGAWFKENPQNLYKSQRHNYKIETVVDANQGLETPWAIDWLPDGKMIVTNRPGPVFIIENGKKTAEIEGIPVSREMGQGGMMEVAVHPNYAKNGWVYLGYTEAAASGRGGMTKIVRGKLKFEGSKVSWTDQKTIFEADQKFYTGAGVHFGTRIAFDGKGHVFFVVGERGGNMLAQELDNPFGKIYRLNEDGSTPKDNPFVAQAAGKPAHVGGIWTLGHRNPQGLVFDGKGALWDTEHGPRGGDEVNEIKKGTNYGWPIVAYSINYNDSPFRTPWPKAGENFGVPAFRWLPSIGACGMDVARGKAFPNWNGDLLAGGLSGANVDRLRMKDGKLVEREELLWGMGRVREVAVGPDGMIYVALNQPDIIIRLAPAQ